MEEEILTIGVKDAARLTSLSPVTIRRQISAGVLPIARVGKKILIPMKSLRALVAARKLKSQ